MAIENYKHWAMLGPNPTELKKTALKNRFPMDPRRIAKV